MSFARHGRIDEDVDVNAIQSKIIRSLVGKLDTYYEDGVYYFVDVQNRFFCNFIDLGAYYDYQETYEETMYRLENGISPPESLPSFWASVMQVFYVPPRNRGRHLQSMFLDYVLSVADEQCEPLAAFIDPFTIREESFADTANTAFLKYIENGIDTTENWLTDSVKQRNRFFKAGFRNIRYGDAVKTQWWQQYLYMPKTAADKYQQTVDKLEVNYEVDMEKLRQLEANG